MVAGGGAGQVPRELVDQVRGFLEQRREVLFAYLFGSLARGRANPLSDVDLAVYVDESLVEESAFGYQADLLTRLMSLLQRTDIDLVILNQAPPLLRFHVIYYGKLVFCRAERARAAFHERAVRDYLDLKPLLAVQHRYLRQRLASGRFGRE